MHIKAWILEDKIGIKGNRLVDITRRNIRRHEVRIKIKACGLNNRDIFISEGKYYRPVPAPCILGSDIAGEIIEIGSDVSTINLGDKVVVYPIIGCGTCEKCKENLVNECDHYDSALGGLGTEYVIAAERCIQIPTSFTYEEAAALPIAYLTAWNMLFNKAKVKGHETILFWGATSGVGTAGLLLYNNPQNSIVVVGDVEKEKLLASHGFHKIINYKESNFKEKLMSYTNNEGVDIIFDPVGAAAWDKNFEYLKNNGVHVNCARNTGSTVKIDLIQLFSKQISIHGAKTGSKTDLGLLLQRLEKSGKKPIIDKIFPFNQAIEALDYLRGGKKIGKVVVTYEERT